MSSPTQIDLRPLLELTCDVGPVTSIGATPLGEVRLVQLLGGTFEGPELRGKLMPGGADWQQVRSDGSLEISARYLLESDAGEKVEVQSNGLRVASPEVLAALGRGELLPASRYYFRTAVRFRTAATRLARLNDLLAVSYGERRASSVRLVVYEVT